MKSVSEVVFLEGCHPHHFMSFFFLNASFVEGFLLMGFLSLLKSCNGNNVEVLSLKRLMSQGIWDISYIICLDFITSTSTLSFDEPFCDFVLFWVTD